MRRFVVTIIAGMIFFSSSAPRASAIIQFGKEFQKRYITPKTDKEFAELAMDKKISCLLCHQGKKRKNHNPYGKHLVKLLDKKKDRKDVEKIVAALKKIEKMHSDPKDDKSLTYGELIKANKFPGGSLEDLKKEPKAEDKPSEDPKPKHAEEAATKVKDSD
jgi:hypothetical protein